MNPFCTDISELVDKGGGVPPQCNYKDDYAFPLKVKVAFGKKEQKLIKKLKKKKKKIDGICPT